MPELKPFEEILEITEKESGIPREKILLAVADLSRKFGDAEKNDLELMAYIYATKILEIPNTKFQKNVMIERADYIPLKDVSDDIRGLFNVRGYLLEQREGVTRNDHPRIQLTLVDETDFKRISFYNLATDLVKNLNPPLKFGEPIQIIGINIFKVEEFKNWGLSVSANDSITLEGKEVKRLSPGELKLPRWNDILTKEIKLKSPVLLSGIVTSVQKRDYFGCPKCLKTPKDAEGNKMNVKENEEFFCNNSWCQKKVFAAKHTFTTITIRDNLKKTRNIVLNPRQYLPANKSIIAQRMSVYGRTKDRETEVNATTYNLEEIDVGALLAKPKTDEGLNNAKTSVPFTDKQITVLAPLSESLKGVAKLMLKPREDGGYDLVNLKSKFEPLITEKFPESGVTFDMVIDYAKNNGYPLAVRNDLVYFGEAPN